MKKIKKDFRENPEGCFLKSWCLGKIPKAKKQKNDLRENPESHFFKSECLGKIPKAVFLKFDLRGNFFDFIWLLPRRAQFLRAQQPQEPSSKE